MLFRTATMFAIVLTVACWTASKAAAQAFTDPAEAGPDFAVQGEYVGDLHVDGGRLKHGAQIVALGGGGFDGVLYTGGLPGAGWVRGDAVETGTGQTADGEATLSGPNGSARIADGVMTVYDVDGNELGKLKKTCRKSPTLGAESPAGAKVLFDGTTAEQFNGGRLVEENLLLHGCDSKMKMGDHKMHLEFRTPFMPAARGQGRGNSGMYVQSRYEVQVLDSFGLEGKDNECGGIYKVSKPIVNACLPPLAWQTFDVDFTAAAYDDDGKKVKNARMTIRHNGILIHDDLELPHHTPGRHGEAPTPDGVFLQNHGNPVMFRNIWVVEK